jgi:hypothetical protein
MIKNAIKQILKKFGYTLYKNQQSIKPFLDMKRHLNNKENPVVFDIGANVGQTIETVLSVFSDSIIYSFEPNETAHSALLEKYEKTRNVFIENTALSSKIGKNMFFENEY